MGYTAITYSFSAGATAKASEVNANFTDIINGLSDGTKDLNVANCTVATTLTVTTSLAINGQITTNTGFGTASPDSKVHAFMASAGAVTAVNTTAITAENSDNCAISILTPSNKTGSLYFGDMDDNDVGRINYAHTSNTITIYTAGVLRVTLNSTTLQTDADIALGLGTAPLSGLHIYKDAGGANLGYILLEEIAADADAPLANSVAIYAVDNGAGKTKLMARFATGVVQQIAIEP